MNSNTIFLTRYKWMNGVEYIFATLDRHVSGEECDQLAEKYFPNHNQTTLPGEALCVDLRPVFRKPLTDVMPKFHAAVRKDVVGPKATLPSMEEAVKEIDKAVKKAIKKGTSAKPKKR
jgi:hypothetical protein